MQPFSHPIVAIVGSARHEIMGESEPRARQAAQLIGAELARCGCSIAVYGSNVEYIEYDVVKGYLTSTEKKPRSIICIYPSKTKIEFEGMEANSKCFVFHTSLDWEVSFYRSLFKMDGILLFGGRQSALIAGQVSLSRDLPIVAVGSFEGAAQTIWREHLSKKPGNISEEDLQIMGRWDDTSPAGIVGSLMSQYKKNDEKLKAESQSLDAIKKKADLYDQLMAQAKSDKKKSVLAIVFLVAFVVFLIFGLAAAMADRMYTTMSILGLGCAGGMGATIRLLGAKAPETSGKWSTPVIGIAVGLVFALIYHIPQIVQGSDFLLPDPKNLENMSPLRVQYICSMLVAFLAGLGFDYSLEQLIKKSKSDTERIAASKQP